MPTFIQYYRNCNCCGSGSSGSCDCGFFTDLCAGDPVVTNCKTGFVVNVTLSFAGCAGYALGSCGSGSSGSSGGGPSTGGDFEPTGSSGSSGSCRTTCANCCDMITTKYQLPISCIGENISSESWPSNCLQVFHNDGTDCLNAVADCNYFSINKSGAGFVNLRIDGYYLSMYFNSSSVVCNPVQITGSFDSSLNTYGASCLYQCVMGSDGSYHLDCITGSFVITEA